MKIYSSKARYDGVSLLIMDLGDSHYTEVLLPVTQDTHRKTVQVFKPLRGKISTKKRRKTKRDGISHVIVAVVKGPMRRGIILGWPS